MYCTPALKVLRKNSSIQDPKLYKYNLRSEKWTSVMIAIQVHYPCFVLLLVYTNRNPQFAWFLSFHACNKITYVFFQFYTLS